MKLFTSILMLFLFISPTFAAVNKLPVEAFASLPEKSLMTISPSANRIAFRAVQDGRDLIAVLDRKTGQYIAVADASQVDPRAMYFISEDKVILRTEQNVRIGGYRGRHDMSTAFVFNLNNQKIHQLLTAGYGIFKGQTALGNVSGISKDGKYAYMPAWKSQGEYSLMKVNLEKRREPRVYQRGTADTIDFFLDKDNQVIARERYNNKSNIHRVQARVDGEWVDVFKEETPYMTKGFVGVTPDGKNLVVRMQNQQNWRWSYFTMSLSTGEFSEPLFSYEDKDVEGMIASVDNKIYGVTLSGFKADYEFFDKKLNARMRGMKKLAPGASIAIHDFSPDMSKMLFFIEGSGFSGDYFLYEQGGLEFLGKSRSAFAPENVATIQVSEFAARDGLTIPTLLTLPNGEAPKKAKTILLPHGGPESYDRIGFDYLAQYFASQGFLVIQPQFRGSKGFGSRHLQLGRGEWGRKMQDDLTDAVKHYAEQGLVDLDNVCIVGASYGGYAALAGAAFTPELYKCVISINGVSDVERMMVTERRDHGSHHWVVSYWEDVISNGDFNDDHLESISPINFVQSIKAPVLLIHGEYDEVVPLKQSENMFDELEDLEKNVTFVELDKGNHYLSQAENRMKALQVIDKFLKKHM